ncbi:MAG TPA: ABC transporter permease [Cyclobacteriaceae bacterium]|nr:ABC transporter permease [Cyclobacteriaceae bacterium]
MLPRWPLKILNLFCPSELVEEIEGDIVQRFHRDVATHGYSTARRKMIWNTFRFIRGGIILRNKISFSAISSFMIPYYIRVAWRNIAGSKFYSSLNLLGLTLGLAVGLLILLWVNNEISYDSFHSKRDRIFRLNTHLESSGTKFAVEVTQAAIGAHALTDVPGVENVVRFTTLNNWSMFTYEKTALKANEMSFVDPSFLQMFDFDLVKGNRNNLFPTVYSVVLTQSEARRFFGDADPIGKTISGDNRDVFTVSAVLKDFPKNSSIGSDMFFSTDLRKKMYIDQGRGTLDDDWGDYGWRIFLELQPGVSITEVAEKLSRINQDHQPGLKPIDAGFYSLQSINDIHLYAADGTPVLYRTVRIFSFIALLILAVAAINYVNLTTARALIRSKEVSIRKVIGATRSQLFVQFVVHTCLFFLISVVFAFGLMAISMPLYNNLAGKDLQFNPFDLGLWKVIGTTLVVILVASSIYPASLLSSFHPVQALRSRFTIGGSSFRKVLVVGQFAFSIGLIICTTIISRQLSFLLESELGFDKSSVFFVQMDNMSSHYEAAKAELLSNPSIESVSAANGNIVARWGATLDVDWDGKDPNEGFFIHDMIIDENFMPLIKMQLSEGRNFIGAGDSAHFILNETAVKETGIKDPIGKRFRWHRTEGTIIGVVKDFHFTPLTNRIQPFVLAYRPSAGNLYVRVSNNNNEQAIGAVENIWSRYNPGSPFSYTFIEDSYNRHYTSDQRTGRLFTLFTGIAIVISCLGLLGLITYTAQLKVKEIGIRKVLGATVSTIVVLLTRNFLVLIAVSILIALPTAWWVMDKWLSDFPYRTEVPWWVYGISCMAAIGIALFTICFQSVRAAIENPVKSLRE